MSNDAIIAHRWDLWWTPSLNRRNSPIDEPPNRSELSPLS